MINEVPLVNKAWSKYFYVTKSNSTAIAERGWDPLNYVLLKDEAILSIRMSINFIFSFNSLRESDTERRSEDKEPSVDIANPIHNNISISESLIVPSSISNDVPERNDRMLLF